MFAADYAQCSVLCHQVLSHNREEFAAHELLIQSLLAQNRDDEALTAAHDWFNFQPRTVGRQAAWIMARPSQWRLLAHAAYRRGAEETLSEVLDQQLVLLQTLTAEEVHDNRVEHVMDSEHLLGSDGNTTLPDTDEHDIAAQSRDVQWQGTTAVLDAITTAALWFDLQASRARDEQTRNDDGELCTTIQSLIDEWCARRGNLSTADAALVELLLAWCHVRASHTHINHTPFTELMGRNVPNEIKIYALVLSFVLEFDVHRPHLTSDPFAIHQKVAQHFQKLTQVLRNNNDPKMQNDVDTSLLYRTTSLLIKLLDPNNKERDQVKNDLAYTIRRPGLSLILLRRVLSALNDFALKDK